MSMATSAGAFANRRSLAGSLAGCPHRSREAQASAERGASRLGSATVATCGCESVQRRTLLMSLRKADGGERHLRSLQPFTTDFPVTFPAGWPHALKLQDVPAGTDPAYELPRKYHVKTAWGTDILFDAAAVAFQNTALVNMTRWYSPAEALTMATADNADLLALSGPRSPYPGTLGVVQAGAPRRSAPGGWRSAAGPVVAGRSGEEPACSHEGRPTPQTGVRRDHRLGMSAVMADRDQRLQPRERQS